MARTDLNQLTWFQAVAEERSFTKAAAKLGVAQSTLSHTIKQLEARMGIRLLTRTTRNVATTAAGERLLQTIAPRIGEIEDEIAALMAFREKPSGSIRLTLSDHALESGFCCKIFSWGKNGEKYSPCSILRDAWRPEFQQVL